MEQERKIAVLIDADNVSPKYLKYILDEIAGHGAATYKRIYGDWTSPQLCSWKEALAAPVCSRPMAACTARTAVAVAEPYWPSTVPAK